MKKLTALLLTVLMVVSMFTFAGCKQKPADELIPDAFEKTSELTSFDIDYKIAVDASVMGMGMEVPVSGKIQVAGIDDIDDLELYASFEVDLSDMESLLGAYGGGEDFSDPIEGEVAYADGWLYVKANMMGEKTEAKADVSYYIDDIMGELDGMDMDDIMDELPSEASAMLDTFKDLFEELLEDADVEREKGNRVVTLKVDTDDINDMIGGVMSIIGYAADIDLPGLSIEKLKSVITVNRKEYIVGFDTEIEVSMDISGIAFDAEASLEFTLNKPGSDVKVKTIKGAKNFEEVDAEDLLG
ncbi:MAG: hypothetical protein IKV39_01755 [Clostridia bacterium]|nr:hypothetical protein [Clostridia bacterium]